MPQPRRAILRAALGIGGLAALSSVRGWPASGLLPTPVQTRGPFYPITRPLDTDADLTQVRGRKGRAQGQVIELAGRVLDRNGEPVRGARIEIWQANAHGRYSHPSDSNPAPLDPNFQGFGAQATDSDGQYRFRTIRPAAYPLNPQNPRAVRTPHVHFDVAAGDRRLVTQMYFPYEPGNEADAIFGRLTDEEKRAATASLLPPERELEPEMPLLRWDIVLPVG